MMRGATAPDPAMSLTPADHDLRVEQPWTLGERTGLVLLVALVPAILITDSITGRGVSLHLLYLVPVCLAAWNLGARAGHVVAAAAGVAWSFVALSVRGPDEGAATLALEIASTFGLFHFVAQLLSRHRGLIEGLRSLARVDKETGTLSRREFDRLLESEVKRSRRYRRPFALAIFDVGEIRNEGAGHLPAAARLMQSLVRDCDCVARIAPRRFAVMLVECKAPEPKMVAERLREALLANLRMGNANLAIAVATYGGSLPASAATMLALAEKHLNFARGGADIAETRID